MMRHAARIMGDKALLDVLKGLGDAFVGVSHLRSNEYDDFFGLLFKVYSEANFYSERDMNTDGGPMLGKARRGFAQVDVLLSLVFLMGAAYFFIIQHDYLMCGILILFTLFIIGNAYENPNPSLIPKARSENYSLMRKQTFIVFSVLYFLFDAGENAVPFAVLMTALGVFVVHPTAVMNGFFKIINLIRKSGFGSRKYLLPLFATALFAISTGRVQASNLSFVPFSLSQQVGSTFLSVVQPQENPTRVNTIKVVRNEAGVVGGQWKALVRGSGLCLSAGTGWRTYRWLCWAIGGSLQSAIAQRWRRNRPQKISGFDCAR
jgi:hypothetical protein